MASANGLIPPSNPRTNRSHLLRRRMALAVTFHLIYKFRPLSASAVKTPWRLHISSGKTPHGQPIPRFPKMRQNVVSRPGIYMRQTLVGAQGELRRSQNRAVFSSPNRYLQITPWKFVWIAHPRGDNGRPPGNLAIPHFATLESGRVPTFHIPNFLGGVDLVPLFLTMRPRPPPVATNSDPVIVRLEVFDVSASRMFLTVSAQF